MARKIRLALLTTLALLATGCDQRPASASSSDARADFLKARAELKTRLITRHLPKDPVEQPPPDVMRIVQYDSPAGSLSAYLTSAPPDGARHAGIVWITGGDCNSIGDVWSTAPRSNDQTARAFREAGIVTIYPSLRGGNRGPGRREGFLGELDDIVAAADFLARQPGVDPQRVFLGGHSTGGTMVLLCAEYTDRFRAVFSFGPAADITDYEDEDLPFNRGDRAEARVRSPVRWLKAIHAPTFVFESSNAAEGNAVSLRTLMRAPHSDAAHFFPVDRVDHFSILHPVTHMIAQKITQDTGPACAISFTEAELAEAASRSR